MVFAPHTDVKHSVFCFRKLLQMKTSEKTSPGQLPPKLALTLSLFGRGHFILLTFDVLIQSSLQGGNK